jgi:hypothetical protein
MRSAGRILFLLFVCSSTLVKAQNKTITSGYSYPEFNIRTSLTSMLEYDAGIVIGGGMRWSDRFSASLEPAWIFYNSFASDGSRDELSGIKLRADLKYYISKRKEGRTDWFIAPEVHFKKVRAWRTTEFGINCVGNQCAFFQTATYKQIKSEAGGLFKLGMTRAFSRHDQRFQYEIYTGFGVKGRQFRDKDLPPGGSFLNDWRPAGIFFDYYSPVVVTMPAGLKFLFVFIKK